MTYIGYLISTEVSTSPRVHEDRRSLFRRTSGAKDGLFRGASGAIRVGMAPGEELVSNLRTSAQAGISGSW